MKVGDAKIPRLAVTAFAVPLAQKKVFGFVSGDVPAPESAIARSRRVFTNILLGLGRRAIPVALSGLNGLPASLTFR